MTITKKRWDETETSILVNSIQKHYTREIVTLLEEAGYDRSRKAVERKAQMLGLSVKKDVPAGQLEEESELYFNGIDAKKAAKAPLCASKNSIAKKIVCISDLHVPFEQKDLVHKIVEEHRGADVLVVNGDMLDLYSVSVFGKDKRIPLIKEYRIAYEYVKLFSENFKEVILVEGNHEQRVNRYFSKVASQEVLSMIARPIMQRLASGEVYNPEGELISMQPFKNVTYAKEHGWYYQIGDTIFAHPSSYLKNTPTRLLGTAAKTACYFKDRIDGINCIVLAHTHMVGEAIYNKMKVIEQGCLCTQLEYAVDNSRLTYGVSAAGYCVVYQDSEGKTDFDKSRHTFLGIVE